MWIIIEPDWASMAYRLTATPTWRGYMRIFWIFVLFQFRLDEFSCVLLLVAVYQIGISIFFFYFIVSVNFVTQSLKKKNRVADRKEENWIPVRRKKKKKSVCQTVTRSASSLYRQTPMTLVLFPPVSLFFFTINRFQKDYSGPSTKNVTIHFELQGKYFNNLYCN
jgi:hypothetical protein